MGSVGLVLVATVTMAGPPVNRSSAGILVLRNGRVLAGEIELVDSGYRVTSFRGRADVPRGLVDVEARNLAAAYRKLKAKMPDRTASGHIVLARWCLLYGLNQQALAEFREAERLAPKNSTARSMIAQLEPTVRSRKTLPTVRMATALMSRDAEPIEALGGLPRDLAAMFVRKIQPLIFHRCGNGSCHGRSAARLLRLEPIGRERSGFGVRTRRNLEAVLGQVDLVDGSKSALLRFAREPHGTAGIRRKSLALTREQLKMLESWVQQLVQPRARGARRVSDRVKTGSTTPQARRDEGLKEKPARALSDVFDPATFNRETRRREALRKKSAAAAKTGRRPAPPRAGG